MMGDNLQVFASEPAERVIGPPTACRRRAPRKKNCVLRHMRLLTHYAPGELPLREVHASPSSPGHVKRDETADTRASNTY